MKEWLLDTLYWSAKVMTEGLSGMLFIFTVFVILMALCALGIWAGVAVYMILVG